TGPCLRAFPPGEPEWGKTHPTPSQGRTAPGGEREPPGPLPTLRSSETQNQELRWATPVACLTFVTEERPFVTRIAPVAVIYPFLLAVTPRSQVVKPEFRPVELYSEGGGRRLLHRRRFLKDQKVGEILSGVHLFQQSADAGLVRANHD